MRNLKNELEYCFPNNHIDLYALVELLEELLERIEKLERINNSNEKE